MQKPDHQWETRRHRAFRRSEPPGGDWAGDARAETFQLRSDRRVDGEVVCGLRTQVARVSGAYPDLWPAVAAWLVARGQRRIDLRRGDGTVLRDGPIGPASLGDDLPSSPPRRVVTLAPSNLEMVAALGCFGRVVACEDSSDWPVEVANLERLGPDLAPDLDRVAALEPDLVVSSLTVPGMERVVTGLRARSVPQLVLAPGSIEEVLADATRLGAALHVPEVAAALVARMRGEIEALEAELVSVPTRVYLEWWPRPMFSPGADCYSNELIRLAGGVNVFADRPGSSVEISTEQLVQANPDACFVSWCGVPHEKLDPSRVAGRAGLGELEFVRSGHIYALDEAFSGRPGPRMLEAARIMGRALKGQHADRG